MNKKSGLRKVENVVSVSKRDGRGVRTIITDILNGNDEGILISGVSRFGIHRDFKQPPITDETKKIRRIKRKKQ